MAVTATTLRSLQELEAYRAACRSARPPDRPHLRVCATGCRATGALAVGEALRAECERQGCADRWEIVETGCHGFCMRGPIAVVEPEGLFYQRLKAEDAQEIVARTLIGGEVVERLLYQDPASGKTYLRCSEIPFYRSQRNVVLRNCGRIDPKRIGDYLARDGYAALAQVLSQMTPAQVIEAVKASGLRGRGGAGFPTGRKWEFARAAPGDIKYLICNGDEGDPGAFMDRGVLEGDPHTVIEGMLIAAYAIGAPAGFIYVRAEYPIAVQHLRIAISQAEELGLLGDDILGTGFSFRLQLREGAGAFVCGEETALIASIEGRRGMPRTRPPFPAQSGLWGKPTNINNVETFANIAPIILNGPEWYASMGTERSKGTKIFSLAGKINNTGLVEVPIGITLREIVYQIGGGVPRGRSFKAVQMGGPSGGCVPTQHLDLPIDYESLQQVGAIMGSGGMIVVDETTCAVDLARFFMNFCQSESCGKCTPCRIGTQRMLEMLTRICEGNGRPGDVERLAEMGEGVRDTSLCALGQTAPNPVLSTIRYFREEYDAHVLRKRCPAGTCRALVSSPCQNACPAGVDAQGYIGLVAQGRHAEALAVVRERIPLPGVCGRVCYHPCERICRRGDVDQPIAINALKRFAADWEAAQGEQEAPAGIQPNLWRQQKVAVIGSGPAGLAAASLLLQMGYPVTVFEAHSVAGGSLAEAIPAYRLPRRVLEREIRRLEQMGMELRLNARIGRDDLDRLLAAYQAVFLAVGAHHSREMGFEGERLEGVLHGLDFLRAVNLGELTTLTGRVMVVGGGNVAIDAARTARRLGADQVMICYRRSREEMPAHEWEIKEAEAEGTIIEYLVAPVLLTGEGGRVRQARCVRMELGAADASGRRRPAPIPGSEHQVEVDWVILAVGQAPDLGLAEALGLETTPERTILIDPETMSTGRPGLFAGGDAVTGPATVVEAFAAGNRAAEAIHRYLQGQPHPPAAPMPKSGVPLERPADQDLVERPRVEMATIEHGQRAGGFDEIELGLSEEQAAAEARRCLRCGLE